MNGTHLYGISTQSRLIAVLILLLTLGYSSGFSQEVQRDTLWRDEGFFKTSYTQGAREIKPAEFDSVLRTASDSTIFPRFSDGRTLHTIGDVLGGLGGLGIGYGLGKKPNNSTAILVGVGVAGIGLIVDIIGNTKMKDAIAQFNRLQREADAPTSFDVPEPGGVIFNVSIGF